MSINVGLRSPLLTIAIPTYNRMKFLERLLASLAEQGPFDSEIELIVSDNASPDETSEVVDRFKSSGLTIRYLRNESNIGPDANILQCYEVANGKYVWIFGDDDFIRPGGIATVLSHLRDDEYDLVHVATVPFTGSPLPSIEIGTLGFAAFDRADLLARRVNVNFTFLSANIVNKERISSVPHAPFSELIGTFLIQMGWICAALDLHRRSLWIRDRIVAGFPDNSGGYRVCQIFGSNLKRITDERIQSIRIRRAIQNGALQRFFPPFLLAQKAGVGNFVREDPHKTLAPVFGDNFRYWFFDFPINRMPSILAQGWLLVVRVINRIDKMIGYPLLGH